jgi:trans-2,3-dihydro-3-hydroxyanthranilate isomerase
VKYNFVTADVFTDQPFGGNPLAVFPDARGLDHAQMHAIAREFNLSETVFAFPPDNPSHCRALRIFTPGGELPFAGHPTVGCAHALASLGLIPLSGEETRIVFEELVGPVPVKIRALNGAPIYCELSVAKLPETGPPPPSRTTLAEILGLEVGDLQAGPNKPQAISCGMPFLFVPVRDREALARTMVHLDRWQAVLSNFWAADIFVFTRDGEGEGANIRGRMFGPSVSVAEDPATGSAVAALGGYLAARDPRAEGTLSWTIEQGFEMGRPSLLHVEADKREGAITAVRVGGASVMMSEGYMQVPPVPSKHLTQ